MKLALNTASKYTEFALIDRRKVVAEEAWESRANESTILLPAIQEAMRRYEKTWSDLEEIVVVKGPGSYTGLRIGIAIANALAYGLKIPVRGMTLFDAYFAKDEKGVSDFAVIDVGKKEVAIMEKTSAQGATDVEILKFENFLIRCGQKSVTLTGEISEEDQAILKKFPLVSWLSRDKLLSFGGAIMRTNFKKIAALSEEQIWPWYLREADVSKGKVFGN